MPKILHLGFGNFHRAHQALYTQLANDYSDELWSIIGVSMRRPDLRDALRVGGFDYALVLRGADGSSVTRMTCHEDILVASEDPEAVVTAIADPKVQIVSLTITEKGYGLGANGALDLTDPAIAQDIESGTTRSAVGLLTKGLAMRAASGFPLTVISCDNLSDNGSLLAAAVAEFAKHADIEITEYLSNAVRFPNTMVDRITPATTTDTIDEVSALTGQPEAHPVITEVFSEWIIEDNFATPRPAWDKAGAVLTQNVAPFEARKLRLLNASHSLLAYGGLLRGHDYVHEAINDPELRTMVDGLWDEAESTLPDESRADSDAYRAALIARFEVPEMRHALRQIAMDGSLKLPVRINRTVQDRLASDQSAGFCCNALAAWIAFLIKGADVSDPKGEDLREICNSTSDTAEITSKLLTYLGWDKSLGPVLSDIHHAVVRWRT